MCSHIRLNPNVLARRRATIHANVSTIMVGKRSASAISSQFGECCVLSQLKSCTSFHKLRETSKLAACVNNTPYIHVLISLSQ
jgi:hypothetical protein